jgi:hypothetical protein
MPFTPGIKRLSRLAIDVSKDWAARRITNLGAPAATGDALRKGTRLSMAEMPDMGLNKIMVGQGAGNSPVEEDKGVTEEEAIVWTMIMGG